MIFLVVYDPKGQRLVEFKEYDPAAKSEAVSDRLRADKQFGDAVDRHEVVLLEADSRDDLKTTHSRYFQNLDQFLKEQRNSLSEKLEERR